MPPGTPDFYSATAQIIPVLVLVLIVEQRDDKRRLPPLQNLFYVLAAIGAAAVGEIVSLRALYRGHAYLQDQYIVVGSIVICGLALTVPVVTSAVHEIQASGRRLSQAVASVVVYVVAYAVVVVFVIVVLR